MKMQEHANKLETNVQGETQNFGIGDASVVIEILRNRLYENKVQTLCQEYICNARDAMREVKKGNDFEVTVPTALNPVFKVRDFGPGISPDRMANVFILYGASTKRGTNNQTGGFGIGAKSAWSYTDSFTIVTIVDGVKRSYVAHTGVNNNGRLDLVSTVDTKEKNGTEIQVAVKSGDINEFRDSILRAIYFWEEKPTLKGHVDAPTLVHGHMVGSNVEVIKSDLLPRYTGENYYNTPLAIIDGVPYSIGEKLLEKCKTLKKLSAFVKQKLIFHIGNGVLEVSASRESIADSVKTVENIEKLALKASLEIKTHIADAFGKVKSTNEYIQTYRELKNHFSIESGFAKYGDYRIVNDMLTGDALKKVKITYVHTLNRYGRVKVKRISKEELKEVDRAINLENFDKVFFIKTQESMVSQNKRLRAYFDRGIHKIYLVEALPNTGTTALDKVITDLGIKDFQTITYVVLPKEEKPKFVREKTEFCMHVLDGTRHQYTTLSDNTAKWLYIPVTDKGWTTDFTIDQLKDLNKFVRTIHGVNICGVAERALKMIAGDKNYSPLKEWIKDFKPSKKEINYAKYLKSNLKDTVEYLKDIKDVKDEELTDLVKEYKAFGENRISGSIPEILLKKVNEEQEVKDFAAQDKKVAELIKKVYPLMEEFNGYNCTKKNIQEIMFYLNAKFEQK